MSIKADLLATLRGFERFWTDPLSITLLSPLIKPEIKRLDCKEVEKSVSLRYKQCAPAPLLQPTRAR